MSTVVFVGQDRAEPRLQETLHYKGFLSESQKEEILSHIDIKDIDDYQINMHVSIELKKYKKP